MQWWIWLIIALLIVGVVVGVSVGISLSVKAAPLPTPVPTTSLQPYPSLTLTPFLQEVVLFYDTFDGIQGVPLPAHPPNAPVGAIWVQAPTFSVANLALNGSGAATNSVNINSPLNPANFDGANISSGRFVNSGYQPITDTLVMEVSVSIPTITPIPPGNEVVGFLASLSRSTPTSDSFNVGFEYKIGQGISNPPSWVLIVDSTRGVPFNQQIIFNSGSMPGNPPIETPMTFTLTVEPDGKCTITCPELGVNTTGPAVPDVIPANGFAMDSLLLKGDAFQNNATIAQPLYVKFNHVLVTSIRLIG